MDGDGIKNSEDMDPYRPYKVPVILLHGRTSNTDGTFGAINGITTGDNDNFGSSQSLSGKNYNSTYYQTITEIPNNSTNLASALKNSGYVANKNLFAFNYANEDSARISGSILKEYITNLIFDAKITGDTERLGYFFRTNSDIDNNNYVFDLVGHSFGGIVSRYYIENLNQSSHVRKLITINTPHWGSRLADIGVYVTEWPIDHDLIPESKMYGGYNSDIVLIDNIGIYYSCTQTLNYLDHGNTKYYAIAGIDWEGWDIDGDTAISNQNYLYEVTSDVDYYSSLQEFVSIIKTGFFPYDTIPDIGGLGDNVVNLLSQMGWSFLDYNQFQQSVDPSKRVPMYKTTINFSTYTNSITNHLHGQNQHRLEVINTILDYLSE